MSSHANPVSYHTGCCDIQTYRRTHVHHHMKYELIRSIIMMCNTDTKVIQETRQRGYAVRTFTQWNNISETWNKLQPPHHLTSYNNCSTERPQLYKTCNWSSHYRERLKFRSDESVSPSIGQIQLPFP